MDKNQIISKINKAVSGSVLEARRFGRSDVHSIWVEAQAIHRVAEVLKSDPDFSIDFIENLSVFELAEALVLTYFVRPSSEPSCRFVLRASIVLPDPLKEVEMPSIALVWPMGAAMEQEAEEMFGIRFKIICGEDVDCLSSNFSRQFSNRLPHGFEGFPLRKKFQVHHDKLGTMNRPLTDSSNEQKKSK